MKATGTKIICMALAYTNGQMVVSMKVIMLMIKKMAMVSIHILMAVVTKVFGKMASSMARVFS